MVNDSNQWCLVTSLPLACDLADFKYYLDSKAITHRVSESNGQQLLWVAEREQREQVLNWLTDWLDGHLILPTGEKPQRVDIHEVLIKGLRIVHLFPLTLLMIALGVLGALVVNFGNDYMTYRWFGFQILDSRGLLPLSETLKQFQLWRLLTPVFLHFSVLHVVFNCLMLWETGRRIELVKGSGYFMVVFIIIGVCSNIAQYWMTPNIPFGGLSGICYGFIGYLAIYQRHIIHPVLAINKTLVIFLLVWLIAGVVGVIDYMIEGSVANSAHVAGLLSGSILGYIEVIRDRRTLNHS